MSGEVEEGWSKRRLFLFLLLCLAAAFLRDRFDIANAIYLTVSAALISAVSMTRILLRTPFNVVFVALLPTTLLLLHLSGVNDWGRLTGQLVSAFCFAIVATWLGVLFVVAEVTGRPLSDDNEGALSDSAPPLDQ